MTHIDLPPHLQRQLDRPQRASPVPLSLSAAIREQCPEQADDGTSDLSCALTFEAFPALIYHHAPVLYALLAHLYLEQPRPEIAVMQRVQDIRTVQQHTRVRLRAQPPQLALSPGHEDRSLKLTLDAPTQLRFPPPSGGSKSSDGSFVTYGLSHVDTLLVWSEQTHTRVCFTPDELQAFRSKPGGTLEVMLDAQHAVHPVRLRAGPDPDRLATLRPFLQGRLHAAVPQFLLPDLHTVVTVVLHHHLHLHFIAPGHAPRRFEAPHDPQQTQALQQLAQQHPPHGRA